LLSRLYLQLEEYDSARQVIAEGGGIDGMGQVPLLLYRHEWRLAGEASLKATVDNLFDWVIAIPAEMRLAITRIAVAVRRALGAHLAAGVGV